MSKFKKLSIVIPAFNEESTIAQIIQKVKSVDISPLEKEIIVVDDGSRDRTRQILDGIQGIRCIFHEKNLGKGGAVKTGTSQTTGDIILVQDADLEYNPEDYPALLKPILSGETEFVVGSRFLYRQPKFFTPGGDLFFSHYMGNLIITFFTNVLYGKKQTDVEGCYKVFTSSVAQAIPVDANGFAFENELICKSLRRGYKIVEVPVQYHSRTYAEGKKISWRDGIVILWTILKWRFFPF